MIIIMLHKTEKKLTWKFSRHDLTWLRQRSQLPPPSPTNHAAQGMVRAAWAEVSLKKCLFTRAFPEATMLQHLSMTPYNHVQKCRCYLWNLKSSQRNIWKLPMTSFEKKKKHSKPRVGRNRSPAKNCASIITRHEGWTYPARCPLLRDFSYAWESTTQM